MSHNKIISTDYKGQNTLMWIAKLSCIYIYSQTEVNAYFLSKQLLLFAVRQKNIIANISTENLSIQFVSTFVEHFL